MPDQNLDTAIRKLMDSGASDDDITFFIQNYKPEPAPKPKLAPKPIPQAVDKYLSTPVAPEPPEEVPFHVTEAGPLTLPLNLVKYGVRRVGESIAPSVVPQLAGEKPGVLNPNLEQNPILLKSFLPETKEEPWFANTTVPFQAELPPNLMGKLRHGAYESIVKPAISPLGLYSMLMGEPGSSAHRPVPEATPESLPIKPPIPVAEELPITPPTPTKPKVRLNPDGTFTDKSTGEILDKSGRPFDPSTLEGLQPTPKQEIQFVDPNTGDVSPTPKPGDVPVIPETMPTEAQVRKGFSEHTMEGEDVLEAALNQAKSEAARPVTRPPKARRPRNMILTKSEPGESAGFTEWVKNLAKGESGEFDPEAIRDAWRRLSSSTRRIVDNWDENTRQRMLEYYPRLSNLDSTQEGVLSYLRRITGRDEPASPQSRSIPEQVSGFLEEPETTRRVGGSQSLEGLRDASDSVGMRVRRMQGDRTEAVITNVETFQGEPWADITELDEFGNLTRRSHREPLYNLEGLSEPRSLDSYPRAESRISRMYDEQAGVEQLHDWPNDRLDAFIYENRNSPGQLGEASNYAEGILQERGYNEGRELTPQERADLDYQTNQYVQDLDPVNITEDNIESVLDRIHSLPTDTLRQYSRMYRDASDLTPPQQRALDYLNSELADRPGPRSSRTSTYDPSAYSPYARNEIGNEVLEKVDTAQTQKHGGALQRLGKLIGESRANELVEGDREIQFSDQPYRTRGKRLSRSEIESWSNWGDGEIAHETIDVSKPGLSIEEESRWRPGNFKAIYRDPSGVPIGTMHAGPHGISILAVRSDLGLRRGKIMFELVKQAFDRGINEPSGATSGNTKNFIERVKRIVAKARDDKGFIDFDVVYDNINKLIDSISNSKMGQTVGKFFKGESGDINVTRLLELFEKQKSGTLTPEELAEAKQLAAETQATPKTSRTYLEGEPKVSTGSLNPANVRPGGEVTGNLNKRLRAAGGKPPTGPPNRPLLTDESLNPDIPIKERKLRLSKEQSMASQIWNVPRSLQSIDLPGVTSAALRQSRPLAFTRDWFKAWNSAFRAFGSQGALDAINNKIKANKYFKPQYRPVVNKAGDVIRYTEQPSIAERLGVKMTDVINNREEAIVSSLAEKIPGYGRYVKASNRAYTGFLNDLRTAKFTQLMEGAKAAGRNPETDEVLGKLIADFVNNATGRGSLRYFGNAANLEPIADKLGMALYSPRALSARLAFMNPYNYTMMDPLVRRQYWQGLARIGASWGAFSGLASLVPGVHVSLDPNNADFGKIRVGNTRIDPGAGFQQLLVLVHREFPRVLGGGGTASSTGAPGQQGKFTAFGSTPMSDTRWSLPGRYLYNQFNPSFRFIADMLKATRKEPVDLTDRTLQLALPMYVTDIADAAKDDNITAEFFAPLLSSMGTGVQTYERGSFNKPVITPFIKKTTGVEFPTMQIGR